MYTMPKKKNKSKKNHYILKNVYNDKALVVKVGWKTWVCNNPIWVPKEVIKNMDYPQKGLSSC